MTEEVDYGSVTLSDREQALKLRNLINDVYTSWDETGSASCSDMHSLDNHCRWLDERYGFAVSAYLDSVYVVARLAEDESED